MQRLLKMGRFCLCGDGSSFLRKNGADENILLTLKFFFN